MRINVYPSGLVYADPNGPYETPIESELLHRFRVEDGVVIDRYDGIGDDEVRERDASDPFPPEEPIEPPPPPPPAEDLAAKVAELEAMNDAQQAQLDDLTTMILEG